MDGGERTRRPRSREWCGRQHRARFAGQHLEVVVKHQHFVALAASGVGGDDAGAVEDLDGFGTDAHVEALAHVAHRDRVVNLADTHPRFGVDPVRSNHRDVEGLDRERSQRAGFEFEVFPNSDPPVCDVTTVINQRSSDE